MTTPERKDAGPTLTTQASAPDAPRAVVDVSMLLSLEAAQAEGGPDIIVELIDLYVEDTPRRVAALRRALEEGDVSAARRDAHALKGSSASLGAQRFAALCDEIEGLPGGELARESASLLTRLAHEFACVREAFADERSKRLLPA